MLFDIYCYSDEIYMSLEEFRFLIEKFVTAICSLHSFKRSYFAEHLKHQENRLFQHMKDKLYRAEFVKVMNQVVREFGHFIEEHNSKVASFVKGIKK